MAVPLYAKVGSIVLAICSLFWLPWICSLILMFLSGLATPLAAFFIGVLADLLYYPGHGWPWGIISGVVVAGLSHAVRHFVRTRIM